MQSKLETGSKKNVLPPAAIAALHRGEKIEAIKIVRNEQRLERKPDGRLWAAIVAGAAILAWMLFIRK